MELIKAQGRLMAIGGGEDKKKDCFILKEFVRLAGDEKETSLYRHFVSAIEDLFSQTENE